MKTRLDPAQHHKTKNRKGFMHPITEIGNRFIFFSKNESPTVDMGCAYGNTVIAALDAGAKNVIACDIEKEHLSILNDQLDESEKQNVIFKQGALPNDFDFTKESIAGIHASLVLPYLSENELDQSLHNFYQWLKPNGKLFILSYSIFIKELINQQFEDEYKRRCNAGWKWPGYLENANEYSYTDGVRNEHDASSFPLALHYFAVDILVSALTNLGFIIEFSDYLDGEKNSAVEETWYDGREFIGVIARKPSR